MSHPGPARECAKRDINSC